MARCLYNSDFVTFLYTDYASIYRILDDNYHGEALTTTRDAWKTDTENKQEQIKYMLNAYRILLTRARAGMVICVPTGNPNKNPSGFWEDSTRLPKFYDGTYEYLKQIGIEEI